MFDPQSRILVIDDAIAMRMAVMGFLKEMGFSRFTEAANGQIAHDLIASGEKFDLILCDHHMPELTGLELLKKVRAMEGWKHVPFIMLTSESEKGMIVQAVEFGASNYISKPVNGEQLKAKLEGTHSRLNKNKK